MREYIKNERSMNEFINHALRRGHTISEESENKRVVKLINDVTGQTLEIQREIILPVEIFDQQRKEYKDLLNDLTAQMYESFDSVTVIAYKRVLKGDEEKEMQFIAGREVPAFLMKLLKPLIGNE